MKGWEQNLILQWNVSQESTTNEILLFCVWDTVSVRQQIVFVLGTTLMWMQLLKMIFMLKWFHFTRTRLHSSTRSYSVLSSFVTALRMKIAHNFLCVCVYNGWRVHRVTNLLQFWRNPTHFFGINVPHEIIYVSVTSHFSQYIINICCHTHIQVSEMNVQSYAKRLPMDQLHRSGFDWIAILFDCAVHINLKICR